MKLHPEDLDVMSFEVNTQEDEIALTTGTRDPNDPTPATWCRICPDQTGTC